MPKHRRFPWVAPGASRRREGAHELTTQVTRLRRDPAERAQAWLVTGPLGHLWSAVVDIAVALARYGFSRLRRRGT
jgi:hypothetical protein